jgi:hypothetical protein
MKFAKFMSSATGRTLRIIVGLALIIIGLVMYSGIGYVIAIIGLIPFLAGLFDFCVIAPLIKAPFNGSDIKDRPAKQDNHHLSVN